MRTAERKPHEAGAHQRRKAKSTTTSRDTQPATQLRHKEAQLVQKRHQAPREQYHATAKLTEQDRTGRDKEGVSPQQSPGWGGGERGRPSETGASTLQHPINASPKGMRKKAHAASKPPQPSTDHQQEPAGSHNPPHAGPQGDLLPRC